MRKISLFAIHAEQDGPLPFPLEKLVVNCTVVHTQVRAVIGEPIPVADIILAAQQDEWTESRLNKALAARVAESMVALKARHTVACLVLVIADCRLLLWAGCYCISVIFAEDVVADHTQADSSSAALCFV